MPWHGDLGVPAEELDQLKMDLHNGGWRVEWEKDEKKATAADAPCPIWRAVMAATCGRPVQNGPSAWRDLQRR